MTLQLRRQLAVIRGQLQKCARHLDVSAHARRLEEMDQALKQRQERIDDMQRRIRQHNEEVENRRVFTAKDARG